MSYTFPVVNMVDRVINLLAHAQILVYSSVQNVKLLPSVQYERYRNSLTLNGSGQAIFHFS
jgi:hypothetical protein